MTHALQRLKHVNTDIIYIEERGKKIRRSLLSGSDRSDDDGLLLVRPPVGAPVGAPAKARAADGDGAARAASRGRTATADAASNVAAARSKPGAVASDRKARAGSLATQRGGARLQYNERLWRGRPVVALCT